MYSKVDKVTGDQGYSVSNTVGSNPTGVKDILPRTDT